MKDNLDLSRAISFASNAHFRQFRKGTDTPYIVHPFETAMILQKADCGTELVIAGLLHDTVEDTDVGLEIIKDEFGDKVAGLVAACSENKELSWEERKQHTIEFIKDRADYDEMLLMCADKLANLRSISIDYRKHAENLWSRFNRGKKEQKWYYGSLVRVLEPLHEHDMYRELEALYAEVFG
ncbi:HD domain-containing protein [Anaerobium acetethylicum]|uniref:HD domain-containing protein n=1 Tax=Anaerobium acetethylicum TaxID=1619234 RepID=A0A1D3TPA4_9FIRM|nr:HD domain-containing protein [Anaerobium acetethylicum]SCP95239.1 HD domain-containing protein [Anaerobium acetethylicum]